MLGLSKIHALTASAARSELQVELKGSSGNTAYVKYGDFRVGDLASNYTLSVYWLQLLETLYCPIMARSFQLGIVTM